MVNAINDVRITGFFCRRKTIQRVEAQGQDHSRIARPARVLRMARVFKQRGFEGTQPKQFFLRRRFACTAQLPIAVLHPAHVGIFPILFTPCWNSVDHLEGVNLLAYHPLFRAWRSRFGRFVFAPPAAAMPWFLVRSTPMSTRSSNAPPTLLTSTRPLAPHFFRHFI